MKLEINYKIQSLNCLGQIIPSLTSVINNITKLTLPVLGIIALSYIPKATAGDIEYNFCMATCPSLLEYATALAEGWIPPMTYDAAVAICQKACAYAKFL